MQNSNTLYRKILALLFDISIYGLKLGKQVSLPGKKGKGNVLSSLFYFFIGIIEKLNFFEHGPFRMTVLLRNKYVKRTVFITGFILFLLSLFEWNSDQAFTEFPSESKNEQLLSISFSGHPVLRPTAAKPSTLRHLPTIIHPQVSVIFCKNLPDSPIVKKFLFIRSLRL
jgi:hypothetical protein